MKSKKLIASLLSMTIISTVCVAFGVCSTFTENVKQNKVYAVETSKSVATNTSANSKEGNSIDKESKDNALNALQTYLGVSPTTSKYAGTMKFDMRTVNGYDSFEWGTATNNGTKNGGLDCYQVVYNTKTQKIENVVFWTDLINYGHPQNVSVEQDKSIAEKFITEHNLADIKNPKFIRLEKDGIYNTDFFYEDANDSSKKAHIVINPDTNQVNGFYLNSLYDHRI